MAPSAPPWYKGKRKGRYVRVERNSGFKWLRYLQLHLQNRNPLWGLLPELRIVHERRSPEAQWLGVVGILPPLLPCGNILLHTISTSVDTKYSLRDIHKNTLKWFVLNYTYHFLPNSVNICWSYLLLAHVWTPAILTAIYLLIILWSFQVHLVSLINLK